MFVIFDVPPRMSQFDMFTNYKGKWLWLTDVVGSVQNGRFCTARIILMTDYPYEGQEYGLYDRLKAGIRDKTIIYNLTWNVLSNNKTPMGVIDY